MLTNQQYQQPGQTFQSPLAAAVQQMSSDYIQNLVRAGQLSQFNGTQIIGAMPRYYQGIIGQLTGQYFDNVPVDAIQQTIAAVVRQILVELQQQQGATQNMQYQTQPFNQRPNPSFMQTGGFTARNVVDQPSGGGIPSLSNQPKQLFQPVIEPLVAKRTNGLVLSRSISKPHAYTTKRDNAATSYSTFGKTAAIVDVTEKLTITEDSGDIFNYCSAGCHVPEPSIKHVINNFVKTNPALCVGKYIADLEYKRFILRDVKAHPCSAIDLSPLTSGNHLNLPIDVTIQEVLKSIGERNANVVNHISKILVKEFNDLLRRYVRSKADINMVIKVEALDDIGIVAGMRDHDFGDLTFHKNYEETVFKCFKEAVLLTITDLTKLGYYNTLDIVSHLIACPSFVIRDNGLCEREMEIDDPAFIAAVDAKYTAFAANGTIVVANFIPNELADDLDGSAIMIEQHTNVFDYLISTTWKNNTRTIRMTEGDKVLVMKNGVTLDGTPFVFKDNVDIEYGLE